MAIDVTPASGADDTAHAPGPAGFQNTLTGQGRGVAAAMAPVLAAFFGDQPPVRFEFWDDSTIGPADGPGTVLVRSPNAINRMVWAPGELGLARAYVSGELMVEGDIFAVLHALRRAAPGDIKVGISVAGPAIRAARAVGALSLPPPRPPEEAQPRGRRHSKGRDAAVISHHYDISNAFYRLILGPSMTYSCARFTSDAIDLETAQESKHDLVARKLGLHDRRGQRLLDVGCGWGSMAMHAARHYDAEVVGITLSSAQAELARKRVTRGWSRGSGGNPDPRLP